MLFTKDIKTPLGILHAVSDGISITDLYFEGQKHKIKNAEVKEDLPLFLKLESFLSSYFNKENPIMDISLLPEGTQFQKMVWKELLKIPYGKSTSYKAIAERVALRMKKKKMSSQAIGQAVGANPIAILIPCHRVLGITGDITGYAGGIDKKAFLLNLEGISFQQNG